MVIDRRRSLDELEGIVDTRTTYETPLIEKCIRYRKKPIEKLSVEELRLLIGQEEGLRFLIPEAISLLGKNPFIQGDYYWGDLLHATLHVQRGFWKANPDLYYQVLEIIGGLVGSLDRLKVAMLQFEEKGKP